MACLAASLETQATFGRHSARAEATFSSGSAGAHHFKRRYTTVKVFMQTKHFLELADCRLHASHPAYIRSKWGP